MTKYKGKMVVLWGRAPDTAENHRICQKYHVEKYQRIIL
jgi:hypothetical protein